ncbi:BapA/Bap/LapF family prefix-like domain-containing protein [Acinetobacter faecalis]|uniref:BapA/Bap/LapF family prefix-like domain-containing protein n=1 Tax=Acinetobacter faecalis TaxID=2665161 RepID=UPI002A918588|nr:BapA prefix-like domain-containing protein [Acinetobacter faecalis]MDY6457095.1 BapA prefix-like domain-containing protein [Acinetobacter faecalis]
MALYNIYNQVTGAFVTNGSTKQPIIVELNVDKANVRNTFKDEQDLIVSLNTGEEIIIKNFFDDKGINKLVIQESNGHYSEIFPSELNNQGLFEVVNYAKIENFADYLYQASVATSGMDWVDAAIAVGAAGLTAGILYENEKDSQKNDDQPIQESPGLLNFEQVPLIDDESQNTEIFNLLNDLELENLNTVETWDNFQVGTVGVDPEADIIDVSKLLSDDATSENIQDYIQVNYDEATQTAIISIDRDGASSSQYDMAEYLTLADLEKSVTLDELLQNNQIVF